MYPEALYRRSDYVSDSTLNVWHSTPNVRQVYAERSMTVSAECYIHDVIRGSNVINHVNKQAESITRVKCLENLSKESIFRFGV